MIVNCLLTIIGDFCGLCGELTNLGLQTLLQLLRLLQTDFDRHRFVGQFSGMCFRIAQRYVERQSKFTIGEP